MLKVKVTGSLDLGHRDALAIGFQEGLPTTAVALLHGLAVYCAEVRTPRSQEKHCS